MNSVNITVAFRRRRLCVASILTACLAIFVSRPLLAGARRWAVKPILLVFLFSLLTCTVLWGQSTAQVSGTVRDQSGAVLPGVQVTATQTATGLTRTVVTDEVGFYVLPELPVGPYKLEASLPGFRTFEQTGIVLQVGSNPVINVALQVGQVAETVEVQADAALVETRSTGVGQVIDNVRVLELPLNARNVQQLIALSGNAVGGGATGTNRGYPGDVISVGGGLVNGLTYVLDGGTHNDPYSGLNQPLPFPDALQEFKVETSSVPAQYGQHSAGAVTAVTKSGTNEFHGGLFEFVRNKVFNARNAFAPERDGLKRNQFGGVVGGPIIKNKLFFFGGDQFTRTRSAPATSIEFVPTAQMLAGDFTSIASPACNSGRQIALRAPFINNRIDPTLFSPVAMNLMKKIAPSTDPCGQIQFARRNNLNEQIIVGKVDYQQSQKNSLFGRFEQARLLTPTDYDGTNLISIGQPNYKRRVDSFVFGDTYLVNPGMVSSFRGTVLRTISQKNLPDFVTWGDLGVRNLYFPGSYAKIALLQVTGAFNLFEGPPRASPGLTDSTTFQLAEDISWARGRHQIGFGVNHIHAITNYLSGTNAAGEFQFNSQNTGLALGDFLTGKPSQFQQQTLVGWYPRQSYVGMYFQDTWKANSHWTVIPGLRWEPYIPPYTKYLQTGVFNKTWFDQGLHSKVFPNAHAGFLFAGDPGGPEGKAIVTHDWMHFSPRLGLAFDPKGDGLMVIRAAYGLFFDYPNFDRYGDLQNTAPTGGTVRLPNPPGGLDNPWLGQPGGNPLPLTLGSNSFPPASYFNFPLNPNKAYIHQWNLSIQRQIASDWLVSASYMGNTGIHVQTGYEVNPAVFIPGVGDANGTCTFNGQRTPFTVSPGAACSTTSNTNQRRVLNLQNPAEGQFYQSITQSGDDGTRNFNALILSIQKRQTKGFTLLANYTLSHCIDDGFVWDLTTGRLPERRRLNRGNCELDRRQNFNLSTVYATPAFSNKALRTVATGWQVSAIVRILSGQYLTIASGLDNALTGTSSAIAQGGADQRPNQVLPSPYADTRNIQHWLNPLAFAQPATGSYGTLGSRNILGPGSINIDMGVTRVFQLGEKQSIQFRAEVFNMPNHVNPNNPNAPTPTSAPMPALTDPNFGKILSAADGRTMQIALKYVF